MLEGLLKKLRGKGKGDPLEKDISGIVHKMDNRLKQAWEKDPDAKKYLKTQGYDPEKKYTSQELFIFTAYLGNYKAEKHGKEYKEKKNTSYA